MRKTALVIAALACLAGCGSQGPGPDGWQESMPISGVSTYHLRNSAHTVFSGTLTNMTGETVSLARIYVRAYAAGGGLLDKTVKTLTDIPPGGSVSFQVYIDDTWQKITRWEYWVEWQE